MKQAAQVCGAVFAVLLASCAASAQSQASDSATPVFMTFSSANSEPFVAQLDVPPAIPSFAFPGAAAGAEPMAAFQKDAPPAGSGADVPPQGVYGVFPSYKYQIFVGYSFLRFYVVPNSEENMNGLDFSIAYFFRDRIAVDGELAVTLGTYTGENSEAFIGMGGLRYRHPMGRFDLWIHGLAGDANFSPQTAFGSENGFGYEVGGGLDYTPRHLRLSWRVQADMLGTHLYGTYQYSPKISIGFVYKD
jgi:opacity protein-like surface antigen